MLFIMLLIELWCITACHKKDDKRRNGQLNSLRFPCFAPGVLHSYYLAWLALLEQYSFKFPHCTTFVLESSYVNVHSCLLDLHREIT